MEYLCQGARNEKRSDTGQHEEHYLFYRYHTFSNFPFRYGMVGAGVIISLLPLKHPVEPRKGRGGTKYRGKA